jgi:hypothetical protein
LIERLIEPDRENRPESAAELIELLDPFVPSPRERRKLGKRVAELQPEERAIDSYPPSFGEDPTERHEDAGDSEAEKRTSGIVGPGESRERVSWSEGEISPRATSEKAGKRAKILGAFSLAVALLVAAAIAWWSTRDSGEEIEASPIGAEPRAVDEVEARQESPSEEPPGAQPEELERADKEAVVEERMDDDVESASLEAEARPARNPVKRASPAPAVPPASLTVVVYPWGDVWINGKPRGAGPLRNLSLKPGRYRIAAGQGEPVVSQTIRLRSGEERKIKLDVTK